MVTLALHRPHWIRDEGENPSDQCAHGFVEFSIDGIEFVSEADGSWTVSAAALFLLRTVTSDHTPEDSVAEDNYLIPCCGFDIWPRENAKYPYTILGCNRGIDPEILHHHGMVHISLGHNSALVSLREWAEAVLGFSDQVQEFYDSSARRNEVLDNFDRPGWHFFWGDWENQRDAARGVLGAGT